MNPVPVKRSYSFEYIVVTLLIIVATVLFTSTTNRLFVFSLIFISALTMMSFLVNSGFVGSILKRGNVGFLIWFAAFFVFIALHYSYIHWDSFSFLRRMRIWLPALLVVLWLMRIKDEDLLEFFGKCCVMASIPIILIVFSTNDFYTVISEGDRFGDVETGLNGNMIALYVLFLTFFALVLSHKCPRWKMFSYITSAIMIFVIMITGCRRALIAVILLLLFYTWIFNDSRKRKIRNILLGLLLVSTIFYLTINIEFLYDIVGFRMEKLLYNIGIGSAPTNIDTTDYSSEIRSEFVPLALAMFLQSPILGNGYAFFITHNGLNNSIQSYSTHNNYLEILVNYGIFGFLLYYSIIIVIAIKLIRCRKRDSLTKFLLAFFLVHLVLIEPTTVNFTTYSIFFVLYYVFYRVVVSKKIFTQYEDNRENL